MANTTLSSIGGVIQSNDGKELLTGAIADGTAKAGWLVEITSAGLATAVDIGGNTDRMTGILLANNKTDMDTAIVSGQPVSVVLPQGGRLYGIYCDANSGVAPGIAHGYHATTDGALDEVADPQTTQYLCKLFKGATGDEYQIFIWGN